MAGASLESPPRSTRQLLDELDALMNRMLALPVEDAPPEPEKPAVAQVVAPSAPAFAPMVETPVEEPEPSWTNNLFDLAPAPQFEKIEVDAPPEEPLPDASLPDAPLVAETKSVVVEEPPAPLAHAPSLEPRRSSSASGVYRAALRFHRRLMRPTYRLGILGRALRSRTGQSLLGYVGLALLVAAGLWLSPLAR